MMRLPMWGMALSVRCMVFRKDPEARRVASASGSCQGRRTESFRSITSSLPGDEGLLPTPLGHLLFDVDAVVVEHLFQCGKQAPAIAVLILFGLGREECERLVFVQPPPSVVDGRTVVKADEVLHRVECAGTLVGIYPRLALGRGVDCSGVIGSLTTKGLVEEKGRLELPGRPLLYGTTENFLRCFNISSLDELPPLPESDEDKESEENGEEQEKTENGNEQIDLLADQPVDRQ